MKCEGSEVGVGFGMFPNIRKARVAEVEWQSIDELREASSPREEIKMQTKNKKPLESVDTGGDVQGFMSVRAFCFLCREQTVRENSRSC